MFGKQNKMAPANLASVHPRSMPLSTHSRTPIHLCLLTSNIVSIYPRTGIYLRSGIRLRLKRDLFVVLFTLFGSSERGLSRLFSGHLAKRFCGSKHGLTKSRFPWSIVCGAVGLSSLSITITPSPTSATTQPIDSDPIPTKR